MRIRYDIFNEHTRKEALLKVYRKYYTIEHYNIINWTKEKRKKPTNKYIRYPIKVKNEVWKFYKNLLKQGFSKSDAMKKI